MSYLVQCTLLGGILLWTYVCEFHLGDSQVLEFEPQSTECANNEHEPSNIQGFFQLPALSFLYPSDRFAIRSPRIRIKTKKRRLRKEGTIWISPRKR